MKKTITIVIITVLLSINLFAGSFKVGGMLESENEDNGDKWTFSTEFSDGWVNSMYSLKKENDKLYNNSITTIENDWNYFTAKVKVIYLEKRRNEIYLQPGLQFPYEQKLINFILIDIISNGFWEIGFRQSWDYGEPSSNLVAGKKYKKELKMFLIPAHFKYNVSFATDDFKKWKKETEVSVNFKLLATASFYLKYRLEYSWKHISFGMEFNY